MLRLLQVLLCLVFVSGCSTAPKIDREPAKEKKPPNADKYARKNGIALVTNEGVAEVSDAELASYKQVVAISDGHGNLDRVQRVLRAAKVIDSSDHWIAGNTLLVVAGDSIDKGPDSIGVLKLYYNLTHEASAPGTKGKVIHVMGNHEAGFLDDPKNAKKDPKAATFIKQIHNSPVPNGDDKCKVDKKKKDDDDDDDEEEYQSVKQYWFNWCRPLAAFLRTMPVAAKVGRYVFSHSGRYPDMTWEQFKSAAKATVGTGDYTDKFISSESKSIVTAFDWTRREKDDATDDVSANLLKAGFYGTVFGHQGGVFDMKGKIGAGTYKKGQQLVLFVKLDTGHGNNDIAKPSQQVGAAALIFKVPSELTKPPTPNMQMESIDENGTPVKIQIINL